MAASAADLPGADLEGTVSPFAPLLAKRLHIVTGKGGTGKTTVAAALAVALATGGRRVLLCEVEARQGIAQLFDLPPLPYEERLVANAPGGGTVSALAIDPEEALLEYLDMFYNLRRAGRALKRLGAIDFATTIAPGMRDVLLTGKIKEAVIRTVDGRDASGRRVGARVYDAVVLDAPPTGRIARFLNVNTEVAGLAKMGPIKGQADGVMEVLRSPDTAVHLVTLLEQMPVQETIDGVAELRANRLPVGGIVVNMVREPLLGPADLDAAVQHGLDLAPVRSALAGHGLTLSDAELAALAEEAADHAERMGLQARERSALAGLGLPLVELAHLPEAVDLGGLYQLADVLRGSAPATAGVSA